MMYVTQSLNEYDTHHLQQCITKLSKYLKITLDLRLQFAQ
jgi:hypothetical protein